MKIGTIFGYSFEPPPLGAWAGPASRILVGGCGCSSPSWNSPNSHYCVSYAPPKFFRVIRDVTLKGAYSFPGPRKAKKGGRATSLLVLLAPVPRVTRKTYLE